MDHKVDLRRAIKTRWGSVSPETNIDWGQRVAQRIENHPWFKKATTILAYDPDPRYEIPFLDFLWQKSPEKDWYFPCWSDGAGLEFFLVRSATDWDTASGQGIRQPQKTTPLQFSAENLLALVPALAIDQQGVRLGRGGGYYDRFLASFCGKTLGIVPDWALVDKLPKEAHDQGVSQVVTPTRLVCF